MVRKILAALDGGKPSESILPWLELLLAAEDSNVTLARVVAENREQEKADARTYLQGVAARLSERGAYVDSAVLEGSPAGQLVDFAHGGSYDMIAICTAAKTGLKRLVLGSVTEDILRHSQVPLFAVHPLPGEARPQAIRTILVPLDGSHRSLTVLPAASGVARAQGAALVLATIVSMTKKEALPIEIVAESIYGAQKALQTQGLEVEVAVLFGDPATEILRFARERFVDLLAISTHGRTGLDRLLYGSVTERVLREGNLPLLIQRTADVPARHPLGSRALQARRDALRLQDSVGTVPKGPYNR